MKELKIILAAPRGFCAGVDRAVQIVERAITKYGPPVYVRHEIVHNKYVVRMLQEKGAVFIDELDELPPASADRPVIFSAHGVPKDVPAEATRRNLFYIDATCPLVSKVHKEAERHYKKGRKIILIGHRNHPEVIGTMGQLPAGEVVLVETLADVEKLVFTTADNLAYCTQTTLSIDDTADLIERLKGRYPAIVGPGRADICYATTNRQAAVKKIAPLVDIVLVIGAPNSSNSRRLVEVALTNGCPRAALVQNEKELDISWFQEGGTIGVTAGASAPEILVETVISFLRNNFKLSIEHFEEIEENVVFNVPRILRDVEVAG